MALSQEAATHLVRNGIDESVGSKILEAALGAVARTSNNAALHADKAACHARALFHG